MEELDGFGVLLVDDHPLFRDGLLLALRQRLPRLAVAAAASLEQARQLLRQHPGATDLVLLDYRLPGENGLQGAARLRAEFPDVACALMSGADDPLLPARARAAGLAGYFPKSLEVEHLVQGLARLARGDTHFMAPGTTPEAATPAVLTARQQDIVRLAARGASNKEIAQALGIAPHTVKNHFAQIFEKLGAANRAQAVLLAFTPGDVDGR